MKKKAEVLNTIEIFSENLINNYELLKSKGKNKELFPVLKANAYGHGIEECVEILDTKKPTYYAVDSYYEALKILKISKTPILIIGPSQINNLEHIVNKKITITILNFNTLDKIVCLNGREVKIHLFFNTGMNREGFVEKDLDKVIKILKENKHIVIDGVLSHFSDADNPQNNYSNFQEKNFSKILDYLEKNNIKPNWIHLGNSAGFLKTSDTRINSFRSGLALYGINPLTTNDALYKQLINLKPVLRYTSTITDIQNIKEADFVSYNLTHKAEKNKKIAILPVGYHELLDRRLSNTGFFKHKDIYLPIIGRVCMNLTIIDSKNTNINIGTKIIIISEQKDDKNSIANISKSINTIPYETLTNIKSTTRRIVIPNIANTQKAKNQ